MTGWERVPCRLWTGASNGLGYGQRTIAQRRVYVHRHAWEQANGRPIPAGMSVLHHCDTPACYEPAHLFLGTQLDNMRDAKAKGRVRWGGARGEAIASHRLTTENVAEIRRRYAAGGESHRALGRAFGVSHQAIGYALRGQTWRVDS